MKRKPSEKDPEPEVATEVSATPEVLELMANRKPDERSTENLTLKLTAPLPLNPDNTIDAQLLTHLSRKGIQTSYFRISVLGGGEHYVPLAYRWGVKQLMAVNWGATMREGGRFLESDRLRGVDFGEVVSVEF